MRKIFKKNQIIVTGLAVLIAVAGYLNYVDKNDKLNNAKGLENTYNAVYSNDEVVSGTSDIKSMDNDETNVKENETAEAETKEPGAAVLTNGSSMSSYMVQSRLTREQTRSKNKETLQEIIDNDSISDTQKKKAVKSMVKITQISEMENTLETLLKAKGFDDVVITITDKQAEVIVSENDVADDKRAQIEDVVKRKTGFKVKNIIITPAKK